LTRDIAQRVYEFAFVLSNRGRMRACTLWLLSVVACGGKPAAVGPIAVETPMRFVVAGDRGVLEVDGEGKLERTLSRTPARAARQLGPDQLAFLTANLREVRLLAGATETVLATLPEALPACEPAGKKKRKTWRQLPIPLVELDLARGDDFVAEADGRLCLALRDRRGADATIELVLRVDARGATELGYRRPDKCAAAARACAPVSPVVVGPEIETPPGFTYLSLSPARRWALLGANQKRGEFGTRELYLWDGKAIFPLRVGAWPAPVTAPGAETLDEVRGTELRWLPNDLLLVDNLLVVPGRRVVELPGDVAR
jgi:hypothetical protein